MTGIALFLLFSFWVTGWFEGPLSMEEATGLSQIPVSKRPKMESKLRFSPSQVKGREPHLFWLGHSGFVLKWRDRVLLLDPNLNRTCTISKRLLEVPIRPGELPEPDAILLSHSHFDHMDAFTLKGMNSIENIIVPKGSAGYLGNELEKRTQVVELEVGQSWECAPFVITAVPAKHNGGRFHPFKNPIPALGYVISDGQFSIYYAGDTGFGSHFQEIAERWKPDVAILPIGAFSPRTPMKFYHLSPSEAVKASLVLQSSLTLPCHFGTFRLSWDHPSEALPLFAKEAAKKELNWQLSPMYSTEN